LPPAAGIDATATAASAALAIAALAHWEVSHTDTAWIAALEAGKLLYFPRRAFQLKEEQRRFLRLDINAVGACSITLEAGGR
jgi:hypothetical protein